MKKNLLSLSLALVALVGFAPENYSLPDENNYYWAAVNPHGKKQHVEITLLSLEDTSILSEIRELNCDFSSPTAHAEPIHIDYQTGQNVSDLRHLQEGHKWHGEGNISRYDPDHREIVLSARAFNGWTTVKDYFVNDHLEHSTQCKVTLKDGRKGILRLEGLTGKNYYASWSFHETIV